MHIGQVGQPYECGEDKLEEKVLYRLDKDGHCLVIVKAGITVQEIENIDHGIAELGIYIDGPILFLLFRFGKGSWNDAPYSWHTVPREFRMFPAEAADSNRPRISLVEAGAGIVRAVREVVFTAEFAEALNTAITVQANGGFNGLSYAKHINIVYNQYIAEDMVELAGIHMVSPI